MIVTIMWFIFFSIGMLLTVPFLWTYYIIRIFRAPKTADKLSYTVTKLWARTIILSTGSKVTVKGLENLTHEQKVCYIANHQSYFDVPLLMGWLQRPVGFIAKKELKMVPILSGWITAIHSAFLDRANARKAIDSINKGIDNINSGHALVIFPEGTRSKNGEIGEFKPGSLKLATSASAVIQPLTIRKTREIYEAGKRIKSSNVVLIIHKPILPLCEVYKDKSNLMLLLRQIMDV
jgi:1-acyl-sn-glycerol-3-phosphate acyltransferase